MPSCRRYRRRAYARGIDAENAACAALACEGWTILGQRLRTEAGEIDVVAATPDMLAIIEVKARATLADAAMALGSRQRTRLLMAAEIVLVEHPEWARPDALRSHGGRTRQALCGALPMHFDGRIKVRITFASPTGDRHV